MGKTEIAECVRNKTGRIIRDNVFGEAKVLEDILHKLLYGFRDHISVSNSTHPGKFRELVDKY